MSETLAATLAQDIAALPWQERIDALADYTSRRMCCSTSFSLEDQVLTHLIAVSGLPIEVFTLDTGRLPEETYDTFHRTQRAYPGLAIRSYSPQPQALAALVQRQGINGFYDGIEQRKACCHVRKVEPLNQALAGAGIWISGLRREQSPARADTPFASYDHTRDLVHLHPLADVSEAEIRAFLTTHHIPYNPLQDAGYASLGCAPCTRAIRPDEPLRAGRWWWEQDSQQECGLHVVDGKFVRANKDADIAEEGPLHAQ